MNEYSVTSTYQKKNYENIFLRLQQFLYQNEFSSRSIDYTSMHTVYIIGQVRSEIKIVAILQKIPFELQDITLISLIQAGYKLIIS